MNCPVDSLKGNIIDVNLTLIHFADYFLRSNIHCVQIEFVCVFSGNQIHDLDIYIMFYLSYKIELQDCIFSETLNNIGATVVTVGKAMDITENVTFKRNTTMLCK